MLHSVGVVLLAGGESRRMGQDKATLYLGGETFLSLIGREMSIFPEKLLSVRHGGLALSGFDPIEDQFPSCGALGGICTALHSCRSNYLLVLGCDMPCYPAALARYLCSFLDDGCDVCLPVDRSGRIHPIGGIYAKKTAPALERQILSGNYRLMHALKTLDVRQIPLSGTAFPDTALANINTPQEYDALLREEK